MLPVIVVTRADSRKDQIFYAKDNVSQRQLLFE